MATYQIYELSARAVMSYAAEQDGVYTFALNRSATEHCKVPGAKHEQDSCAMFHQLMYQLHGKGWRERGEEKVTALSDVLFYMDFAGIFDRRGTGRTQQARREKARDTFRPEGITLDFGSGPCRYVAFERSASMSRQSRLSFIRADLYEPMRQRIMLDMELDRCQLSKLYAYNGLMFSSGTRVDGIRIDKKHRVIVIDNPTTRVGHVPILTLWELDQPGKFRLSEDYQDLDITCFDGVGLISKEYAEAVDKACCGSHTHTSFQIRMPYIKGMLHQVDFKDFLKRSGTQTIVDIWGKAHPVRSVDIILTRSQFKAYGWLRENGMTWEDYWDAFRDYNHALYITNLSKTEPEKLVELNYQFLSTLSIQPEEFRPADLPEGADYYDLLTDFRHGGFRMLGDLVCDMDDLATARERKQLRRPADSPAFQKMMEAYLSAPFSGNERAVVSKVCRKLLNKIIRPSLAVPYIVALGKRNLLWDLLPDHIEEHVLEVDHAE